MKNRQKEFKLLYLACSIFGIGYFILSIVALFVGGAMREVFFGLEDSLGSVAYFASMLFWWVSVQLYLRSLPEPKLPGWAKKLCVVDLLAFLGVLALRLLDIYVI